MRMPIVSTFNYTLLCEGLMNHNKRNYSYAYSWVAEVWKPFFSAASLADFKTVSNAKAFDRSPDNFNFPVMKAVAGASSPKVE